MMKKLAVLMFAVVLACDTAGRANAAAVFLPGVSNAAGWLDVEQGFNNYCWAATSSNMLKFSGWDGGFASNAAIFSEFTSKWTNVFGNPYYAIEWWFDGTNFRQGQAGWPQVTAAGGNYYTEALFNANLGWGEDAAGHIPVDTWIKYDVDNDRAFTLLFGNDAGGLHWLTGWGYDTAATGVWVTDSWDGVSSLFWLPLTYSVAQDRYNLNYQGANYYVKSMESLGRNSGIPPNDGGPVDGGPVDGGPVDGGPVDGGPVDGGSDGGGQTPEPVTLLLFAAGLAGLGYRARSRQ